MGINTAKVQKIYVAFFNRPGDVLGQAFWESKMDAGMTEAQVAASFAQSAEYTSLFTGMNQLQIVSTLYTNLFGRSASLTEANFWAQRMLQGLETVDSIALTLANSAQGTDADAIANKVTAATTFTDALDTLDEATNYSGSSANAIARNWLATVTSDAATLTSATASVDATITSAVNAGSITTGQSFTLTTSANTFNGSSGNDTFEASLAGAAGISNTLNVLDSLNGGAGTDTLIAEIRTGVTPASLAGIEVVNANFSGAVTLGLSNAADLTTVVNQGSTANATFSGLAAGAVNLTVTDVASQTTAFEYASTTGSQTVALEVSAVTGAAAAQITIDGIETINVEATGSASTYQLDADAATTLSFAGSSNQTVTLGAATLSVSKFDGSTATGNITLTTTDQTAVGAATDVTVLGGAGNDSLTLSAESNDMSIGGGAGNDTIVHAGLDANDTVDGGDGTDTLSTVMAQANALDAATPTTYTITNVERLTITDAFDGTLAVGNIATSIDTVNLTNTTAGAGALMAGGDAITGPASALTVNIGGTAAGNVTTMGGALTVTDTGSATTDAVTLNNTAIDSTAGLNLDVFNVQNVTSTGYESVTINTGARTGGPEQEIGTLTITPDSTSAAVTLTLTGTNAMDINALSTTSTGLLTIDASGLTAQAAGTTTLDLAGTTQGTGGTASITGSAGYDVIDVGNFASTIVGGAGNDNLSGGTAADSITGDAGDDTIAGAGGNDTLLGGEGNDQITDSVGGSVSIDGGAGNDTVVTTDALLTSGDTLVGGDGTDTLSTATAISTGTTAARISGFEILSFSATGQTQNMANFVNNTFTQVNSMGAALTLQNVGSAVTTLGLDVPGGLTSLTRLVDTSADALTVVALTDAVDADNATVLTVDNEETLTFNTNDGDLQIRTLNAADVTSITVTGDNAFVIETAIVGSANLATVNASGVSGTEAITINASASTKALTFTGGTTTGVTTLTTGAGNDVITAGSGATSVVAGAGTDSITGGAGADTLNGGSSADTIIGGEGTDTIIGGTGADVITLTETTSVADLVDFTGAGGQDTITGFKTTVDKLSFDGVTLIGGGAVAAVAGTAVTAGAVVAGALTDDTIYVINNGATALTAAGVQSIDDYTNLTLVATYLNEGYTSTADNDAAIFVINDLVGDKTYVYVFDEQTGGASTIQAADLTLVGVITEASGAALVAGDIA